MQFLKCLTLNYEDISKTNHETLLNFCRVFELPTEENNLIQTIQNYITKHNITNYLEARYHYKYINVNKRTKLVNKKQAKQLTLRDIRRQLENKWRADKGLPSIAVEILGQETVARTTAGIYRKMFEKIWQKD